METHLTAKEVKDLPLKKGYLRAFQQPNIGYHVKCFWTSNERYEAEPDSKATLKVVEGSEKTSPKNKKARRELFVEDDATDTTSDITLHEPVPFKEWLLGWVRGAPNRSIMAEGISVLWAIWRARNRLVFDGGSDGVERGIQLAVSMRNNIWSCWGGLRRMGWAEKNIRSVFASSALMVEAVAVLDALRWASALMVEAVAVLDGRRWALGKRFRMVEVLTDCLVLVQTLQCVERADVFVKPVLRDMLGLMHEFDHVAISKVPRNVVRTAQNLAKSVMV
ncbi:hypothetical protein RHMOL_Rhmol05G0218700 [Rhododendron molle]|uniref:Uncharacterized protein n=1 Tax=Rhododendron molle TaxID=49168 RepID=A0ACC0NT62_RHOML|nr:hypothetical protein RHMOL_Rhmol05G0218700 [Rhododendron molle]